MKKFICLLLAILMVAGLAFSELPIVDAIIPGEDAVNAEEKIVCHATLDDDFADDRVLVVLTNSASISMKTYGVSDFAGIGC